MKECELLGCEGTRERLPMSNEEILYSTKFLQVSDLKHFAPQLLWVTDGAVAHMVPTKICGINSRGWKPV